MMMATNPPAKPWLPVKRALICPDCGGDMPLRHKPDGWHGGNPFVYLCTARGCPGLLSAHPNGDPVGEAVPKAVRQARRLCHAIFDPLWVNAHLIYEVREQGDGRARAFAIIKRTARKRAYEFVADRLGVPEPEAHIGMITDIAVLRRFYAIARDTSATEIRAWAKARRATNDETAGSPRPAGDGGAYPQRAPRVAPVQTVYRPQGQSAGPSPATLPPWESL